MKALLVLCLLGAVYSYAIYPLVLLLVPARRRPAPMSAGASPSVTLIIACRNEAARIADKLANSLAITYRPLEVIVASDASDDRSDEIVRSWADRGVRLVRSPGRLGKEHAQGLAIAAATGDILVFSDAGTSLPPDSIDHVVAAFADSAVGAVSSEDRFISADGKLVGEGAYVRYEMWLRRLETRVNSLVGLSGSFFAIRREVADGWDSGIPSDFACALSARRHGLVAVSAPDVVGIYKDISEPAHEYQRKVRTALRGMAAVARRADVLNPLRYGLFAFQVWSHKIMRWAVPWFLVGALLASLVLAERGEWLLVFWLQVLGYLTVILAHVWPRLREQSLVRLGYFFVQVNLALAHAAVLFLRGRRVTTWNPSVR